MGTQRKRPIYWVATLHDGRIVEVCGRSEADAWAQLTARVGCDPTHVVAEWTRLRL